MAFRVKFGGGSQSNLSKLKDSQPRAGLGGRGGGGYPCGEDAGGEANSDESDACSIVSTEGGGRRRRGRRSGRRRRGRGGGGTGGSGEEGAGGERGSEAGYGYMPRGAGISHGKQQQVGGPSEASGIAPDVPELSREEGIRVFNILLRELNGRARLGPLMSICMKRDALIGLTPPQIAAWLKASKSFLTFEREGYVKLVSVRNKNASCCFKNIKHGTDKCVNNACPFFHVCRDFVAGCCTRGSECRFSHSFHAGSNAKICTEGGLQAFTDEEIRTIVRRSGPVVCLKFNRGSCQWTDCPDIHVCSRYLRGDCSAVADCQLGHEVKGTEHNLWVWKNFSMTHVRESTMRRLVVAPKLDPEEATGGAQAPPPDSTHKAKKPTEKAPGMATRQINRDCLPDDTRTEQVPGPTQEKKKTEASYPRADSTSTPASANKPPLAEAAPQIRTQEAVNPGFIRNGCGCAHKSHPRCSLGSDSIAADTQQTVLVAEEPRDIPQKTKKRSEAENGRDLKPQPRDSPGSGWIAAAYVEKTPPLIPKPQTPPQKTSRCGESHSGRDPESQSLADAAVVDATGAEAGAGKGLQPFPASHYAHLCEQYSSTGTCNNGDLCTKFHHPYRLPYVWQVRVFGEWQNFSQADNLDIEERFRALATHGVFQVFLDTIGGLELVLFFQTMAAKVRTGGHLAGIDNRLVLSVRRWSTPSYVEAEDSNPLGWYTQWCWYRMHRGGYLALFTPATLQYTLEEKYKHEQKKYYFEEGETRYLVLPGPKTHDLVLLDLNEGRQFPVFRRPVSDSVSLLNEKPWCEHTNLPAHWSTVDRHQDFEMVELESSGQEYLGVARSFHTTVACGAATILRVFRVQNPSVWDRYCSMRRAMTPRGLKEQDVDERNLFHGTPTLAAVRGICANNMDFRRAGDNVGARFGKGAYFSAHAVYSQHYTSPPDRYMFLARVLVGRYTLGHPGYSMPPVREGLKHYDSCVNDEANPTIFVIFDLAQSYPEYLIQFKDSNSMKVLPTSPPSASAVMTPVRQATAISRMGSGVSTQGSHASGIVKSDILKSGFRWKTTWPGPHSPKLNLRNSGTDSSLRRSGSGLSESGTYGSGTVSGFPTSGSGLPRLFLRNSRTDSSLQRSGSGLSGSGSYGSGTVSGLPTSGSRLPKSILRNSRTVSGLPRSDSVLSGPDSHGSKTGSGVPATRTTDAQPHRMTHRSAPIPAARAFIGQDDERRHSVTSASCEEEEGATPALELAEEISRQRRCLIS